MIKKECALAYDDIQIIPKYSEVLSRKDVDFRTYISKHWRIRLPIISSPMDTVTGATMAREMKLLGGIGAIHRFCTIDEQVNLCKHVLLHSEIQNDIVTVIDPNDFLSDMVHPGVIGTVGVTGDWWERTQALIDCGVKIILLDVAHGHHILVKQAIEKIKVKYPQREEDKFKNKYIDVIAGNVATGDATRDLCEWGADGIRVGIGGGSACTTRIMTGVGVPMANSILDCVAVAQEYGVPIIADSGIRTSGDVAKAIGLGADTVMIGSMFAGTKETPGRIIREGELPNETLYKEYRGSASHVAKADRGENTNVEGATTRIKYRGPVKRIVEGIKDGLSSGMSYVGAKTINEFQSKCEFTKITSAGIVEAKPHGLVK